MAFTPLLTFHIAWIPSNSFFLAICAFLKKIPCWDTFTWGLFSWWISLLTSNQLSLLRHRSRGLSRTSANSFADSVSLGGNFCAPHPPPGEWLGEEAVFLIFLLSRRYKNTCQQETGEGQTGEDLSGTSRRRVTIPSSRPMKISSSAG